MIKLSDFLEPYHNIDKFVIFVRDKKLQTLASVLCYKSMVDAELHPDGLNVLAFGVGVNKLIYVYCTNDMTEQPKSRIDEAEKTLQMLMKG